MSEVDELSGEEGEFDFDDYLDMSEDELYDILTGNDENLMASDIEVDDPRPARSPSPRRNRKGKKGMKKRKSPPRLTNGRKGFRTRDRKREMFDGNTVIIRYDQKFKNNRVPNRACRYLLSHCSRKSPTKRDLALRRTKVKVRKRKI